MSRAEYVRILCQKGISFSLSPRGTNARREDVSNVCVEVQAQILAAQAKKVEQYAVPPAEEQALLERINKEMQNNSVASSVWPPDDEMEVEEDLQAPLIAARKMDVDPADIEAFRSIIKKQGSAIVIDKFNIDMTVTKISCLRVNTWLNDEVVNFYMCLLQDRDQRLCLASNGTRVPSYFFNSFFISKLLENGTYNYANVKRWSKKFDAFAMGKIFMPVNLGNTHWVMAVVHMTQREIHYYDSMSGGGKRYLEAIRRWLVDEAKDKKKIDYDTSDWKLIDREDCVPQQKNGVDCGVFSIICADYLADDLPLCYTQAEMPMNRHRVAAAIMRGSLDY